MTMGKRGWFLALLVWVFAGGGCWLAAAGEDDAEPSPHDPGFREWFFAKNGLDKLRDVQTVYPASVRDNLAHASALSTKDYLLASSQTKTGMLKKPETGGKGGHHFCSWLWAGTGTEPPTTGGHYYWDRWQVIDTTPANYGAVAAKLAVFACPDSREMIREYCGYWGCISQMGIEQYVAGFKRNDALRLGDLALCWRILKLEEKDGAERFAIDYSRWKNPPDVPPGIAVPEEIDIDFFRNGVVVMAEGHDSGNFRYLRFLRDLDALLRHDGANPPPAPGGLPEGEYRAAVEKYQAWREEEAKKESERRAREWARRQAERAPALAPGEPRGDASADCACPAPAPRAQAPRQGGHWLWRLLKGGCE